MFTFGFFVSFRKTITHISIIPRGYSISSRSGWVTTKDKMVSFRYASRSFSYLPHIFSGAKGLNYLKGYRRMRSSLPLMYFATGDEETIIFVFLWAAAWLKTPSGLRLWNRNKSKMGTARNFQVAARLPCCTAQLLLRCRVKRWRASAGWQNFDFGLNSQIITIYHCWSIEIRELNFLGSKYSQVLSDSSVRSVTSVIQNYWSWIRTFELWNRVFVRV